MAISFSKPFFSLAGQGERLKAAAQTVASAALPKFVTKTALGQSLGLGQGVLGQTGNKLTDSILSTVASHPFITAAPIAVAAKPAVAVAAIKEVAVGTKNLVQKVTSKAPSVPAPVKTIGGAAAASQVIQKLTPPQNIYVPGQPAGSQVIVVPGQPAVPSPYLLPSAPFAGQPAGSNSMAGQGAGVTSSQPTIVMSNPNTGLPASYDPSPQAMAVGQPSIDMNNYGLLPSGVTQGQGIAASYGGVSVPGSQGVSAQRKASFRSHQQSLPPTKRTPLQRLNASRVRARKARKAAKRRIKQRKSSKRHFKDHKKHFGTERQYRRKGGLAVHHTKNGQPYVIMKDGRARFIKKSKR